MHYSQGKTQLIAQKYQNQIRELVRAHYYFSQERINALIHSYEEMEILISDIRVMTAIAQDAVATAELVGWLPYQGFPTANSEASMADVAKIP